MPSAFLSETVDASRRGVNQDSSTPKPKTTHPNRPIYTFAPRKADAQTTEVQQLLRLLFRRDPVARSVNQISFAGLSLALRVNLETYQFGICVTDLEIGAPHV